MNIAEKFAQRASDAFASVNAAQKLAIGIYAGFTLGMILMYIGQVPDIRLIGLGMSALSLVMYTAGFTKFDPGQVGILKVRDRLVKTTHKRKPNGELFDSDHQDTIPFKGNVLLADYWPFFIGAKRLSSESDKWVFEKKISSCEGIDDDGKERTVPVPTKIIMTVALDPYSADWFIQAGESLEKEKGQVDGIAKNLIQGRVKTTTPPGKAIVGWNHMDMVQQGNILTDELVKEFSGTNVQTGMFDQRRMGIKCSSLQIECTVPEEIEKAQLAAATSGYINDARRNTFRGDVECAEMLGESELLQIKGRDALDAVVELEVVRQSKAQQLQFITKDNQRSSGAPDSSAPSNSGTTPPAPQRIIIESVRVNLGDQGGGKGKKKDKQQGGK